MRLRLVGEALRSGHVLFRLRPLGNVSPALAESRKALDAELESLRSWYRALGEAVLGTGPPPAPLPTGEAGSRILRWVRYAASGANSELPPGLAIAWTGEHIETLRRLQPRLSEAAASLG
jgi:hypothetical protein